MNEITYPPELLPIADEEAEVVVVDPETGVETVVHPKRNTLMNEEIPDELIELAGEICSQIAEYGKPAQETIAQALMAERKRCAKIADEYDTGWIRFGPNIAAAIRRGTP